MEKWAIQPNAAPNPQLCPHWLNTDLPLHVWTCCLLILQQSWWPDSQLLLSQWGWPSFCLHNLFKSFNVAPELHRDPCGHDRPEQQDAAWTQEQQDLLNAHVHHLSAWKCVCLCLTSWCNITANHSRSFIAMKGEYTAHVFMFSSWCMSS